MDLIGAQDLYGAGGVAEIDRVDDQQDFGVFGYDRLDVVFGNGCRVNYSIGYGFPQSVANKGPNAVVTFERAAYTDNEGVGADEGLQLLLKVFQQGHSFHNLILS